MISIASSIAHTLAYRESAFYTECYSTEKIVITKVERQNNESQCSLAYAQQIAFLHDALYSKIVSNHYKVAKVSKKKNSMRFVCSFGTDEKSADYILQFGSCRCRPTPHETATFRVD